MHSEEAAAAAASTDESGDDEAADAEPQLRAETFQIQGARMQALRDALAQHGWTEDTESSSAMAYGNKFNSCGRSRRAMSSSYWFRASPVLARYLTILSGHGL